jgi:hypothetical protein
VDGTKEGSNAVEELLLPDEVAIIGDGDNDLGPSQSFDAAPLRAQRKTSVATAARVEQLSAIEEALRAPLAEHYDSSFFSFLSSSFRFRFNPRN